MVTIKQEKFSSIFIIGDLHGDYRGLINLINIVPEGSLIICVGDFGIGFPQTKDLSYYEILNNRLAYKNVMVYTIRGNHDNPSWFAGGINRKPIGLSHIKLIPDYTYKNINGEIFAFVGGAISIDRNRRVNGISYWEDEAVWLEPLNFQKADVLICHTAPSYLPPVDSDERLIKAIFNFNGGYDQKLFDDLKEERKKMDEIVRGINPDNIYYGHFHFSTEVEEEDLYAKLLDINEWVDHNSAYV